MHPVFERLRKRKVVSWAVAYTAAAGVMYSILEGPSEPWGITDARLRAAQVALVGGLLVTLVLAWYHGEQGRQTVSTSELLMIGSLFALVALGIRLVWTPTAASDPRSPSSNWAVALGLPSAPEPGAPAAGDHAHPFDISRDGRLIVYRGGGVGGDAQLWLREQGSLDPISLLGTERGDTPSLSPDGSEVLFWRREAGLLRMPVRGGPPAVLAPDAYRQGSTWGADGFVYYAASDSTIRRVPVGGGDPEAFTAKEAAFVHRWPHALPGDGAILLTVTQQPTEGLPAQMEAAADSTFVGWASGEDRVPVRLFPGTNARFVDSGHILYMTVDGVLTGVSFDPRTGEAGSSHVPLRDDVWFSNGGLLGRYAISGLGDLLFWERSEEPAGWNDQVVWVDRGTGVVTPIDETWNVEAVTTWSRLELSPDGTHLAYSVFVDGTSRQRVRRLSDGTDWAIDPGTSGDRRAHWLHDGVGMTFVRAHYDPIGWWVVRAKADGSGEPETLLVASDVDLVAITEAELTPDGEWVIVRAGTSEAGGETSGTATHG